MSSELSQVQQELAALLQQFAAELQALASKLGPPAVSAPPVLGAPSVARSFRIPTGVGVSAVTAALAPVQAAIAKGEAPSIVDVLMTLAQLFAIGVKILPYTGHNFFVATEPVVVAGNTTDIGRIVDFVIVIPSVDAQIEFDKTVSSNTPTIKANTIVTWALTVRIINHKAISGAGTLTVFAAWY